jgi:hypothetical protein
MSETQKAIRGHAFLGIACLAIGAADVFGLPVFTTDRAGNTDRAHPRG